MQYGIKNGLVSGLSILNIATNAADQSDRIIYAM